MTKGSDGIQSIDNCEKQDECKKESERKIMQVTNMTPH